MRGTLPAVGAVVLLAIAFVCMCSTIDTARATESVSARDLSEAFAVSEEAARERFAADEIIVSGVVNSAEISIYLTPAITLSDMQGGEAYAVCVLPRLDALKLSNFSPGDTVKLKGRFYRYDPTRRLVVVKQCVQVE